MPDQLPNYSSDPTAVDHAASKACTQSGTVALLLSVALFLLTSYWIERPKQIALGQYVGYRLNLANQLDTLDADPNWQEYRNSLESAESMPIAQLVDVVVSVPGGATNKVTKAGPQPAAPIEGRYQLSWEPLSPKPHSPAAPTGTHDVHHVERPAPPGPVSITAVFTVHLEEMRAIADYLAKLNDPRLLEASKQASNFFDLSIARWANKRNKLMYRNAFLHTCTATQLEVPTIPAGASRPDNYVPLLDRDALLTCLTLRDVRELAKFELPTFGNPLQLDERIQKQVDVQPGSLRGDLFTASIVVQGFLFFIIVYFGAFAHEAVSSAAFPAPGTLFGVFSRLRWNLVVMLFALWTPLITSVTMSVVSRRWLLMACNAPIVLAVLSVHRVLQCKSYFGDLRPRALRAVISRRRRVANPSAPPK